MMNISQVIERLEEIKKIEGDILVVTESDHEYWGTLYYHITEDTIRVTEHAQPNGPMTLSPKDRLNFLMAWMPYERPKLATVEQIIEVSGDLTISREERASRIMELASKIKPNGK